MKSKKSFPKKSFSGDGEKSTAQNKAKMIKSKKVKYNHKNHWLENELIDLKNEEE